MRIVDAGRATKDTNESHRAYTGGATLREIYGSFDEHTWALGECLGWKTPVGVHSTNGYCSHYDNNGYEVLSIEKNHHRSERYKTSVGMDARDMSSYEIRMRLILCLVLRYKTKIIITSLWYSD